MSIRNALALLCAASLASAAAADTINVPQDHETIGAAVAAAANGDTIVIKKGRYAESVVVDGFQGLTIRAKGKVVIEPPAGPGMEIVDCDDVTVQGIGVEDATDGFIFDNCADVVLTKFSVRRADRHGVFAVGSSNVNVSNGTCTDCGFDGVSFADEEPDFPVIGGTVSKVRVTDCGEDGIDILGVDILVVKCTATDCGDDCFESDDFGAGPVRFEKCTARDCGDECFELACAGSVAVKCKATDPRDDGFDVEGDDCTVEKCTVKGAGEAAVSVDDVDGAKIVGCKAIKCESQGFATYGAMNATFDKCKSTKSGGDGFYLDSSTTNCTFTKCKATKSRDFDLRDESNGSSTFPGSKFKTIFSD